MKKSHIFAIVLIAVAIGAILSTVASSGTYSDFSSAEKNKDMDFHVNGKLNKAKDIHYNPEENANLFTFYMVDKKGVERKVLYNGSKPQDFEKSDEIVLVGRCTGDDFLAKSILLKCPSKYSNPNEDMKEFKAKG
jgi:cytochrome c-type biogenesis protein CcmE